MAARRYEYGATLARFAGQLWCAPISLLGLLLACLVRATGGTWRIRDGALEAYGGGAAALLMLHPVRNVVACAIGHVIVARDRSALDGSRSHEQEHMRQFDRWGLLFPLAYGLESAWQWLSGRCPYRDNRFERAARQAEVAPRTNPP